MREICIFLIPACALPTIFFVSEYLVALDILNRSQSLFKLKKFSDACTRHSKRENLAIFLQKRGILSFFGHYFGTKGSKLRENDPEQLLLAMHG